MEYIKIRQITSPRETSESNGDIVRLVNEAFTVAEAGLWSNSFQRVTETEIASLISDGQLFGAYMNNHFVGCVKLQTLSASTAEFGMLAVSSQHRGCGVGGMLVQFVEELSRERGHTIIECGTMVPRDWVSPSKEFVRQWYLRSGYREVSREPFEDLVPTQFKEMLITRCDHIGFRKELI